MRVVVTGGASGIGLAIAQRLASTGSDIFLCDVDAGSLDAVLERNPTWNGRAADVGEPSAVEVAIQEAEKAMGGIDLLVNNAGIAGPKMAAERIPYEEFDSTIRINLNGMFYAAKNVIPGMKKRGAGCIINISTSSARVGLPFRTAYVVSKSGVLGLTLNLARELGPFGIRCNCILPGAVDNPRGRNIVAAMAERQGKTIEAIEAEVLSFVSMRTWIDPKEVAAMVQFLASDDCRHVTAQFIGVCGNVEWEG